MTDDKPDLAVIEGQGTGRKPWSRENLEDPEQITCPRCETETGVATSTFIRARHCPRRAPDGQVEGGTFVLVCAYCMARGEITEIGEP